MLNLSWLDKTGQQAHSQECEPTIRFANPGSFTRSYCNQMHLGDYDSYFQLGFLTHYRIYTQDTHWEDLNVCHKFDLDLVFKVTMIIENFHIWNFWNWHKLLSLGWKYFIIRIYTSVKELPNIHQPDQFDLRQGHSSSRHFQWKSMACTLKKYFNFITTTNAFGPLVATNVAKWRQKCTGVWNMGQWIFGVSLEKIGWKLNVLGHIQEKKHLEPWWPQRY